MSEGHLQDRQEREIFEHVEAAGLDPHDFVWDRSATPARPPDRIARGAPVSQIRAQELRHGPTGHRFSFELVPVQNPYTDQSHTHWIRFSPGRELPSEQHRNLSWEQVLQGLDLWLSVLAAEHETVNPWEALARGRPDGLLPGPVLAADPDEAFGPGEQKAVARRLDELEREVLGLRPFGELEAATLRREIERLRTELRRYGKGTWIRLLLGTPFRIATLAELEPAEVATLMDRFLVVAEDVPA